MIPDRWFVLGVRVPGSEVDAGLLAEGLLALGGRAVEEDGEWYRTYLPPPEDPDTFLQEARAQLERALGVSSLEVGGRWQSHVEWQDRWREGLLPRRVSPRLVVSPPWESPDLDPGQILVIVDPGMAFGTAEHPTTRGCLRLLDQFVEPGQKILDLGAGSGILSIAAVRLGAEQALAVEQDAYACASARANVEANGVEAEVEILEALATPDLLERLKLEGDPVHGVVANIESGVIVPLLPSIRRLVEEDGWVILSGIRADEREEVVEEAELAGMEPEEEDREDEWWSALFRVTGDPAPRP